MEKNQNIRNLCSLPGWHVGTCSNTTEGVAANLLLTIYGATDTALHGELALFGDLAGGGGFQGAIDNGQVTFTTAVPAAQVAITWHGTISGGAFAGDYVVRCDNPKVKPASRHQVGVWSCKLIRSLSAPDPDEASAVWVYNDGTEEGPLTAEAFDQRLNDGEWPPNAIVGLDDRTTWSTVAACLEKIIALAAARN